MSSHRSPFETMVSCDAERLVLPLRWWSWKLAGTERNTWTVISEASREGHLSHCLERRSCSARELRFCVRVLLVPSPTLSHVFSSKVLTTMLWNRCHLCFCLHSFITDKVQLACKPPIFLATSSSCPVAFAEKRRKRHSVCHYSSHALYSLDGLIPLSVPRKAEEFCLACPPPPPVSPPRSVCLMTARDFLDSTSWQYIPTA